MPRNDPRTERGLAVARRMQDLGVAKRSSVRASLEAAIEAQKPRPVPPEVLRERAAAELAAAGRRISPADLAGLERLYQFRGWPAVRQALLEAKVVSAEALRVADPIVQEHGFAGLGDAVRERIAHENVAAVQAQAAPQAAALLAGLSPADAAVAAQILAQGGPGALAERAVELGIPPAVAVVAARTVQDHGLEGARQAAALHVRAEQARAAEVEAGERTAAEWTPKDTDSPAERAVKESSPIARMMRDRGAQDAAEAIAQRLVAAGVPRPKGSSALEYVVKALDTLDGGRLMDAARQPFGERMPEDRRLSRAAALFGTDEADTKKLLDGFETARAEHGMLSRLAQGDAKRAKPTVTPARNELRETVERSAAKHGAKGERVKVGNALQATIAMAAGHGPGDLETFTSHADRDIEKQASGMDPKPDTSLRGDIERAMAAETTNEEEEPTE